MLKRSPIHLAAALALAATLSPAVQAQDSPQRVEITGSSIKRVAAEGALPVQTFGQADIQRSGATSVTDFMQKLPVMSGFTSIADSVGGTGGGVTTASLHDVGEQYTLVLLNGRRVAPANSGTTIDLNSIPLAAIERIEVLTDGASALYGADAIAGVVNFILKRGESPFQVDIRTSRPQHRGGEQLNLSVSKGFGRLDREGFELFVAGSYDKSRKLRGADRDFAKTGLISGRANGLNFDFFNGSSRAVPPNVDVFGPGIGGLDADGAPIDSISFSPYLKANGKCPADHVVGGQQCLFDYTSTVEIAPEIERKAIYGSGRFALGQSGWTAFGDLAATDVSTVARIAPYPAEFGLATTSPFYASYIRPYLTGAQDAVATDANVKYRLYDLSNRTYDYNTRSLHTVGGVEGQVSGWDVTGALTVSTQKQLQNYLAGFPLADKFNAAINAGQFDPFPYAVGTMPAAQLAALQSTQFTGNYDTTKISMVGFDANAQRPVFQMPGGASVLSLGVDMRRTGYKLTPNPAVANAEILFDDVQNPFDLSRRGWGTYGELLVPVSKTLEATASLRYDAMSGVKDKASGQTFGKTEHAATFKLGGKWNASGDLLLRASYGTGFRTATMREIAQPKVDFGVTSGTYDCPFSAGYDPLGYVAAGYICENGSQLEVYQRGNPNLKPEKSSQWNLGAVFQATRDLSVGLNYWAVEVKDAVSSVSEQLVVDNPARYLSLYTTKFKSSNGKTYVAILDSSVNIGRIQNEGIDWDLSYKTKTGFGRVEASLAGTHLVKSRYTVPGTADQWTTSLGKFGVNDKVAFRDVLRATGTVVYGHWSHTLTANHRSGYTDQPYSVDDCVFTNDNGDCVAGALRVPSYSTFDWQTRWNVNKLLTLVLGIENLADRKPPLSLRVNGAGHQLGYDPRYASPYGRTYSVSGSLQF